MNKPVVVSEEALAAPVLAPDAMRGTAARAAAAGPAYIVLAGISFSHFLNDTMQSLIASVYPILKDSYALNFAQIGMITLAFQFTASLLQPVVGHFTDKKAQPFSLAVGMGSTFFGLLLLSVANQYAIILVAAALVGLGSAVFHPESARIARLASGGRYGFAQSVFQLGGSFGTSMGPVLAVVQKLRRPVSEVCHRFDPLPQILKNVRYRSGKPLDDAEVKLAIDAGEKRLNGHGRLLVRSSGTEPVIRVMGEGDDRILIEEVVDHIVTALGQAAA